MRATRIMALLSLMIFLALGPMLISGETSDTAENSLLGQWKELWIVRLLLNLMGYATIVVPGYLIIRYVRNSGYLEKAESGWFRNSVQMCVVGNDDEKPSLEDPGGKPGETASTGRTPLQKCLVLLFCAAGLQGSYLTWGVLQERIMARKYGESDTSAGENFKNSQFLVFMNRILAFLIGSVVLLLKEHPRHKAPLYKYSYSSFSNVMSSWFQYEALKYVSFPTQVLAKASKVIPVMLMGKVISKKTFEWYEYGTAALISLGVSMFLLTSGDAVRQNGTVTTFSGVILLLGYLLFDAFTSNWQGELFRQYKMTSIQMMVGVNLFSVLFTSVSLFEQGGFIESVAFMNKYPLFVFHIIILSICSATGQLFIFYTIATFGPVTFTIIMTIRQGLAILLSCIIYSHPVTLVGVLGILTVFAAVFLKIYFGQLMRKSKAVKPVTASDIQPHLKPTIMVLNGKT